MVSPLYRIIGALMLGALTIAGVLVQSPAPLSAAEPTATPKPLSSLTNRSAKAPSQTFFVSLPLVGTAIQTPTPKPTYKKGTSLTYSDCDSATKVGAYWQFGWSPSPASCVGIENIPMLWGAGDINTTLGGNSNWILGYNEPDSASQANLTPQQAAVAWRGVEQKYPTRKLAAPAPSGANPNWIVDFRNTYIATYGTAPRLDALTVHCYAWYASQCITHTQTFEAWASAWGTAQVWVTEFSFSPTAPSSPAQSLTEATTYINWMQNESQVTHYAMYTSLIQGTEWWALPAFPTALIDWNTRQLSAYGSMYVGFR